MRKKIVAFAVTAAMIVTSAVPAFAVGGWGETAPVVNDNPNVVVIDSEGITTDDVKGDLKDGVDFQTVIDFNNCKDLANKDALTLSLTFAQDKSLNLVLTKSNYTGNAAEYTAKLGDETKTITGLSGICIFNWSADEDGVTVEIRQPGKSANVVGTLTAGIPDENLTSVISLHASAGTKGSEYIMYVDYPENIQSVQVVDKDGKEASQPAAGETYSIDSITLDYDTVLSADDFDLTSYVNVRWTATKNGKTETLGTGLSCTIPDNDKTKGAVIGVTVTYKDGTGIYGTASWGDNNDPLAVADRIYGDDRYKTAIAAAEELRATLPGKTFTSVVIADGGDFSDALSGTALAAAKDAPILLVDDSHQAEVVAYIEEHMDYSGTVYILGGTTAVSEDFEKAVAKFNEVRLGGATRYDTNIEIMKEIAKTDASIMKSIAVCAGTTFADALSVSATGMPVLLVGSGLTDTQDEYLKELNTGKVSDKFYIIGGTSAVSEAVERELRTKDYVDTPGAASTVTDVVRYGGSDRYDTNKLIVEKFAEKFTGAKTAYLASSDGFADALTGGALAANQGSPLLLVNDAYTEVAGKIVADNDYDIAVIGGVNAVSNAAVQAVYSAKTAA